MEISLRKIRLNHFSVKIRRAIICNDDFKGTALLADNGFKRGKQLRQIRPIGKHTHRNVNVRMVCDSLPSVHILPHL